MLTVNKHIFVADFYHYPIIFLLYFFNIRERKLFVKNGKNHFCRNLCQVV